MDLRIQDSNPFQLNTERLYQKQQAMAKSQADEDLSFFKTLQEKESVQTAPAPREAVLSMPEMATLHALFGSEKPLEQGFYGKNESTQIYKGHLLDVAG